MIKKEDDKLPVPSNGVDDGQTKVSLGFGPAHASCQTKSPFMDTLKVGTALILTAAGGLGITWCYEKIKFYFWKKKKDYVPKEPKSEAAELVPFEPPKEETLDEICNKPGRDYEALVGKWLGRGDCLILYGAPGIGKSSIAMNMCIDIAKGEVPSIVPPEDSTTKCTLPQTIFYYDAEKLNYKLRYGKGCNGFPKNLRILGGCFPSVQELFKHIGTRVEGTTTDVIICIDNLSMIISSTKESEVNELFRRQQAIREAADKQGRKVTFIILHHPTKEETGQGQVKMAGSHRIMDAATNCLVLMPAEKYGENYTAIKEKKNRNFLKNDNIVIVKCVTSPNMHFEYYKTVTKDEFNKGDVSNTNLSQNADEVRKAPNEQWQPEYAELIKNLLSDGMTQKEIGEELGVCEHTIGRWIVRYDLRPVQVGSKAGHKNRKRKGVVKGKK